MAVYHWEMEGQLICPIRICSTSGEKAFVDCKSIRHIALPASLTSLGNYAFESCRVSLVVFFYDNHCTLNLDEFYFPTKSDPGGKQSGFGRRRNFCAEVCGRIPSGVHHTYASNDNHDHSHDHNAASHHYSDNGHYGADHGIRHKRFGDHDHAAVYYRDGDCTGDHDSRLYGRDNSLF